MWGNPTLFQQAKSFEIILGKDICWQQLLRKYWEKVNSDKNYWIKILRKGKYLQSQ